MKPYVENWIPILSTREFVIDSRAEWRCHLNRMEASQLPKLVYNTSLDMAEMLKHRAHAGMKSEQVKGLVYEEDKDKYNNIILIIYTTYRLYHLSEPCNQYPLSEMFHQVHLHSHCYPFQISFQTF